jgi:alpha-L-rhamnosidase
VEHGATTMWERWNGDRMRGDPSMNSYNHYAYGAVGEWLYRYAAGIDTVAADPGFHTIALHPVFDARLGSLDFSYESPYGTIRSTWKATGSEANWQLTIPPNSKGRLQLPAEQARHYLLDGKDIARSTKAKVVPNEAGEQVYEFEAGTYSFTVGLP